MKNFHIGLFLAAILWSCTEEHDQILPTQAILTLNGNTSEMTVTRSSSDLAASTQTGVYALETGNSTATITTTPYANALYTAVGNGNNFTSDSPLTLSKGKNYRVCAYAPYLNTINHPAAVTFTHGTDVLYASFVPVTISKAVATATLTYNHAFSQIRFILASGHGSPDLTGATLKATGFFESCSLNLSDGNITPVAGNGATVTDINKAICFVPGTQSMTLNIIVTTNNGSLYKGTISRIFLPGYAYTYTLTLNNTDLEISGQIIDWSYNNGGSITVTGE